MDSTKPMTLLLIEDDVADCVKFKDCANRRGDVKFIGMTDSSSDGIKLVQSRLPEGVILDLQLTKGEGSGIKFMDDLNKSRLPFRPIVVVTTTNTSEIARSYLEGMYIDFFYSKKQRGYSEDLVIEDLLRFRNQAQRNQQPGTPGYPKAIESPEEKEKRCYQRIDAELDMIGIRSRFVGRSYLRYGIYLQIYAGNKPVIDKVAEKFKYAYNTISAGMQTAINDVWDNEAPEELVKLYPARLNSKTGSPTPSDFIHYLAEKIRNSI
jgi:response regulator RpfG family c-di-GMP phosphodiesterase